MRERLRRYLETRLDLGEPEWILPGARREEVLQAVRRCAAPVGAHRSASEGEDRERPEPTPKVDLGKIELSEEEIRRLAERATGKELRGLPNLATLRRVASECRRCALHGARQHVVFGEGNPAARVVCVGEAPGAVEDRTGRPFVGRAGQLLDRLLAAVGFERHDVYICNVLKCRPPGNRDPRPEEIEACAPYLLRQLELIRPKVIVAFGAFAARTLLGARESLGRLRGRTHLYEGFPVVVTYHPAALLRNPSWTRPTWEDLQRVREMADGGGEAGSGTPAAEQGGLFG